MIALAFALWAGRASAVEIQEVKWGFDGGVVPERMNLLSVLVASTAGEVYDGVIAVHKTDGLGNRLGATLVQQCFVAPFTSRWVQFYPYVSRENETWIITSGSQSVKLPAPRLGPPAAVCLQDPRSTSRRPTGLKSFPDNLFPTTVSGTDGLDSMVLDHTPRWELFRREAFLDWLRRGGTLHLARGEGGEYPQFSGDLSVLNNPASRFRVGAGLVARHEASGQELNEPFLAAHGFPAPVLSKGDVPGYGRFGDAFFFRLKDMVSPHHNWPLIYGVLLIYIGIVGPVNYVVGRKLKDFRAAILLFLVAVAGFGGILSIMGRRGYGEDKAIHTLSYARPVGADSYDVTQWINVFVVRGDQYRITYPDAHNLYSTCRDYETVNGIIQSGREGTFMVDIPLYSSRGFLHRGKMKGHDMGVEVVRWQDDGELRQLELCVGPGFPENVLQMWALHGDKFYKMVSRDGRIEIGSRPAMELSVFLSRAAIGDFDPYWGPYPYGHRSSSASPEETFREMLRPLIARSLGGAEGSLYRFETSHTAKDCVQLFVFAGCPEGFKLVGEGLGQETGYVLYHLDLFRPEETDE